MIGIYRRRSGVLVAAALATLGAWSAPAATASDVQTDARTLIQSMWESVVPILADKGMAPAAREARFAAIYRANFDGAAIASAVAGPAWQQATPEQRARFLRTFEIYVVKVYAGQFANYSGERLIVAGSEPERDGAIVTTHIVDAAARGQRRPELKWRLRPAAGGLKVRDVLFENISMALNQRREFAAVLQQRGGTLDGLTAALDEKIASLSKRN